MRFARLHLKAFGAFQDRVIELPPGQGHDLHVVFGRNEAGKSTLLRAVSGFLFGFPDQRRRSGSAAGPDDAFLHDYSALRVGAKVDFQDGRSLSAMRRKARKATLFPIDEATGEEMTGQPLPDSTAAELTGGLDLALYQSLFGLNLEGLVEGSEALLQGEGDVGRSLFQAAAGLSSLRTILGQLDAEAEGIFKARGTTPTLNRALEELAQHRKALSETTVRVGAWETAEREHAQAQETHARLRNALKERRAGLQRLQRIRANLPLVAERAGKLADFRGMAQIPALPPEAAQRRVTAQERLRQAAEALRAGETRLERLAADAQALVVPEGLLQAAAAIEQAYHGIEGFRSARDCLPGLTREHGTLAAQTRQLRGELGPSGEALAGAAGLPQTLTARVQALIEEHQGLTTRDEQLQSQVHAKTQVVGSLAARLAAQPQTAGLEELETAVAGAAGLTDLETRKAALARELADEEGRLQREMASLWDGPPEELMALTVPLTETAGSFEKQLGELAQEERLVADREEVLAAELEERSRELRVLSATGEVVTQSKVSRARSTRDERWMAVSRLVIEGTQGAPERPPPRQIAADFEHALREADRLADLLRADTERVTRLETVRQQIAAGQNATQRNEERRTALAARREQVERRWAALAVPLRQPELTPAGLREWLTRRERIMERHERLTGLRAELTQLGSDIARAGARLRAALVAYGLKEPPFSESGGELLARAAGALKAARKAREEREVLSRQIETGRQDLEDWSGQRERLKARLTAWGRQWAEVAQQLALPSDARPEEARTRLTQHTRLAEALARLGILETDIQTQESVVRRFAEQVATLAQHAGTAAGQEPPDTVAERLYAALGEARHADAKRRQVEGEREQVARTVAEAQVASQQAAATLEELVRQGGCRTPAGLPEIEQKAEQRDVLGARLREIDNQLVAQNAQSLDDVLREAGAFTLDGMTRQIEEDGQEIADLERQAEAAYGELVAKAQGLARIDGGTRAAETQQAMRSVGARIGVEARTYARVRLAHALLGNVVQLYREQHQGTLLTRAAEVFARITLAGFPKLTVDHDEDRQVLLGVRADGRRVPVGGMSQGTRDQLFLALRLAAIEQHLESRGPHPVIVDDLLVQFDDERALATLEVLSEISCRTQVLLFTHHGHLIEQAERSGLAGRFAAVRLGS